jgi:hypothetical protein
VTAALPLLLFAPENSRTASTPHAGSPAELLDALVLARSDRRDFDFDCAGATV